MGLITPRGYGLFLSETHFIEIINIFSMPFFFKFKLKTTSPVPYTAIFNTLWTPIMSQPKLPKQLDFLTDQSQ